MIKNNIDVVSGPLPSGVDGYAMPEFGITSATEDAGWNASNSTAEYKAKGGVPSGVKKGMGL